MLFEIESVEDQKRQINKAMSKLAASFVLRAESDKFGKNEDSGTLSINTVKKRNINPSSEQKTIKSKESFSEAPPVAVTYPFIL